MNDRQSLLRTLSPILLIVGLIIIGGLYVVVTNKQAFFSPTQKTATTKLDSDIATAEKQVAGKPVTAKPYIALAELYLQKVRETSNADYYAKIDALMDKAATIEPDNGDVPAVRASTAMGRHNFIDGKKYALAAIAINKTVPAYFGLNGDADIELGQYQDAVNSFQTMVNLRPDFASWSRIAYIRELYGDVPGALTALEEAISSGSNYPENIAWAYVEQGKLHMRTDLGAADTSFTNALHILPTYTQAMEGLGKGAFFRGDMKEAEKQFTAAYNGLALAQYAVDLGDLYEQEGNSAKAAQQYALAQAAFNLSSKGGVDTDLEESLFLADHELNLSSAVAMATRAYHDRPSEYGADYLSWALYKNGDLNGALRYTKQALVLGEIDPLILFHQGMIALKNGDTVHAKEYLSKAYALNPHFSMQYVATLKETVAALN